MKAQEENAPATTSNGQSQGFWTSAMKRFRRDKPAMVAYRFLQVLVVIAILADLLAYNKPLLCTRNGSLELPVFGDYLEDLGLYKRDPKLLHQDWRDLEYGWSVWPPVRYLPNEIDYKNKALQSPFSDQAIGGWKHRHWFGTDRDGRDVLSGLIHGARLALTIGLVAMGIAGFIGVLLGAMAGYYGDNRWKATRLGIYLGLIGLILGYFYGFQVRTVVLRDALESSPGTFLFQFLVSLIVFFLFPIIFLRIGNFFRRVPWLGTTKNVWVDVLLSRVVEIKSTIPNILLIITIMAMTERKSIYFVMIIIGLLGWTPVARYMRSEMLRTRSMAFIESARASGLPEWRILLRHAIPNSLTSVLVVFTFGVASAISTEAALSFLGVGVPDDIVTWGGMLRASRSNVSAWWLAVFPGLAVFLTVTSLNLVGEALRDVFDPRMRHF